MGQSKYNPVAQAARRGELPPRDRTVRSCPKQSPYGRGDRLRRLVSYGAGLDVISGSMGIRNFY